MNRYTDGQCKNSIQEVGEGFGSVNRMLSVTILKCSFTSVPQIFEKFAADFLEQVASRRLVINTQI